MYYAVTGSTDLTTKEKRLLAWDFAENAGTPAAARVLLRDGGATGSIVIDIRLAASESKHAGYSLVPGRVFPSGVYVDVAAGTVRGSVELG